MLLSRNWYEVTAKEIVLKSYGLPMQRLDTFQVQSGAFYGKAF